MEFTVVCAVYNAEKYLDCLLESIFIYQNYDSSKLFFIGVDDGSSDESASVLQEWMQMFPGQISCMSIENGGQGNARNVGLRHVQTEWVTFVDSDDFLDENYFETIAEAIEEYQNLQLICCRNVAYQESTGKFKRSHFLDFRFREGEKVFDISDEEMYPHHSAATAFFRYPVIRDNSIQFPTDLRVSFEDSAFLGRYIVSCGEGRAAFLPEARYYARRREHSSSVTASSYDNPEYYLDCIEKGVIPFLELFKDESGHVRKNAQLTVLYDLVWRIQRIVDGPSKIACLSDSENELFEKLLERVFSVIDPEVIETANPRVYWYFYKAGMLARFKSVDPKYKLVYLRKIDFSNSVLIIRSFRSGLKFFMDGHSVDCRVCRNAPHSILGRRFVDDVLYEVPFSSRSELLTIEDENGGRYFLRIWNDTKKKISLSSVIDLYTAGWKKYPQKGDIWLISDSIAQADDNGEHFYRYMKHNHPEIETYYVLSRDSSSWKRLSDEHFALLEYGTDDYEKYLRKSSTLVSSQLSKELMDYWGDCYYHSKRIAFLQHGVTKDDISRYINSWNVDVVACAMQREYEEFVNPHASYLLPPRAFSLTGFPRHDALIKASELSDNNLILVAPTWRKYLVGGASSDGLGRAVDDGFFESRYALEWFSLLGNLVKVIESRYSDLEVAFLPHPNMRGIVESDLYPDSLMRVTRMDLSYQEALPRTRMLITDYSSLAFDNAVAKKQTLYFQFDKDEFFKGEHSYKKGYFDYETDGFGPIVRTVEEAIPRIEAFFESGDNSFGTEYVERIDRAFAAVDSDSSQRVYNAIMAVKSPYEAARPYLPSLPERVKKMGSAIRRRLL